MALTIEKYEQNRLVLAGRLDNTTMDAFQKALEPYQGSITLDMSRVDYINSAGLSVILATYQRLKKDGGRLVIQNPAAYIREVLSISGLDYLVEIKD